MPSSYPANHSTPTKLLLWMHGCGGYAYGDAWVTSPGGTQSWLTVSVGGRDGQCWNVNADTAMVLAALDDVKKRVHVDPKRVVIGGYSSGGDMAYRVASTRRRSSPASSRRTRHPSDVPPPVFGRGLGRALTIASHGGRRGMESAIQS